MKPQQRSFTEIDTEIESRLSLVRALSYHIRSLARIAFELLMQTQQRARARWWAVDTTELLLDAVHCCMGHHHLSPVSCCDRGHGLLLYKWHVSSISVTSARRGSATATSNSVAPRFHTAPCTIFRFGLARLFHCSTSSNDARLLMHALPTPPPSPPPSLPSLASAALFLRCLVLVLLSLLCSVPPCLSVGSRQQHNVWYNGLQITGIAVDEASGDVFFSDAAANRVLRQAADGALLAVYEAGFYSPQQLAYDKGKLYVADSTNNRVAVIDVQSGEVRFSTSSLHLTSCTALAVNPLTGNVLVADGFGTTVEMWSPDMQRWSNWTDLSPIDPPPLGYLASVTLMPYELDEGNAWMNGIFQSNLFVMIDHVARPTSFSSPFSVGNLAVQFFAGGHTGVELYILSQFLPDTSMQVALIDDYGTLLHGVWTARGEGGGPIPFFGWAMHVDSQRNMYISDHGVDEQSKYGRVVKIAPNGTELGQWSMSDGVAYAPTSIWYDDDTTAGGSCAFWMTDSERGMVRVAADGSVLLPFYAAPVDPADGLTAQFNGMAEDTAYPPDFPDTTFVLLDTASAVTTKLWRFLPYSSSYILLNSSTAAFGPNLTGIAVNTRSHLIYVSNTPNNTLVILQPTGEPNAPAASKDRCRCFQWDSPVGLYFYQSIDAFTDSLFVVDMYYNGSGAIVQLETDSFSVIYIFFNDSMLLPLSVTVAKGVNQMYVADTVGQVFQYDLASKAVQAVHVPLQALHIFSMTASDDGNVYMVEAYSHRLIILLWSPMGQWSPVSDCRPPTSSSSSTAVSPHVSTVSSSSSSSSSGTSRSVSQPLWSAGTIVGVAVLGLVAVAGGASCCYSSWRRQRRLISADRKSDKRERLMGLAAQGDEQDDEDEEEEEWDEEQSEDEQQQEDGSLAERPPDADARRDANGGRCHSYEYYVARYEVLAAVSDMGQLDRWQRQTHSVGGQPLSIRIPSLPSMSMLPGRSPATTESGAPATSVSTTSLSSSSSTSTDRTDKPSRTSSAASVSPASTASAPTLSSPSHISQLQSVLRTTPTFIDSVTDLTILGEGSSGVVYRGMYRGVACVVKLPKSASLTGAGAAWREWQCHLSLPPHAHLVRFLGALPMAATNYLVLSFVRQGSLHSLLSSAPSGLWYGRPYMLSCAACATCRRCCSTSTARASCTAM